MTDAEAATLLAQLPRELTGAEVAGLIARADAYDRDNPPDPAEVAEAQAAHEEREQRAAARWAELQTDFQARMTAHEAAERDRLDAEADAAEVQARGGPILVRAYAEALGGLWEEEEVVDPIDISDLPISTEENNDE